MNSDQSSVLSSDALRRPAGEEEARRRERFLELPPVLAVAHLLGAAPGDEAPPAAAELAAIAIALVLSLPAGPLAAAEADDTRLAVRTAAALYDGIRAAELDNGLRVYLKPIPGSTAVKMAASGAPMG